MYEVTILSPTHVGSVPERSVEWLLVWQEQVLDVRKAFDLELLWFLLDDLPTSVTNARHPESR